MLGDIFRKKREERALSLKDVEKETNIRSVYLKAIENEDYFAIKGEVYLKGFIRAYAKFLDMDPDAVINQYNAENPRSKPQIEPSNAPINEDKTVLIPKTDLPPAKPATTYQDDYNEKRQQELAKHRKQRQEKNKKINFVFAIIIAFVVLSCAAYFVLPFFWQDAPAPTPINTTTTAEKPVDTPAPAVSGVHLKAVFTKNCWTEVKADGVVVLAKTVTKGTSLEWNAKKSIDLKLGNAGAVKLTFNGKELPPLGADGSVINKTFTATIPDTTPTPTETNTNTNTPDTNQAVDSSSSYTTPTSTNSHATNTAPTQTAPKPAQQTVTPVKKQTSHQTQQAVAPTKKSVETAVPTAGNDASEKK